MGGCQESAGGTFPDPDGATDAVFGSFAIEYV